jgi:phospholipid/cholesterol/gamma-HCH transport system substrate-binding protein
MKISNETKIGALTIVAITLLILGFNFLKGRSLFEHKKKIYAVFKNVDGLELSNAVRINGLQIGTIYAINETDKDMRGIVVTINLKKDIHIPRNSLASISTGLISSASIVIAKGDAPEYLGDGDTVATREKLGLSAQIEKNIDPIVGRLTGTLESLDSLIQVVGSLFDPRVKNNISSIFAHLATSSASLQTMLNMQTGALARSLNSVDSFTGNLAKNNQHITNTLDNLDKTTTKLSNAKIEETVQSIQSSMNELNGVIQKANNPNGSLGLLLNDKKLYQNLESTTRSLNTLLDDFRVHPKRYVNISVFGRKDKSGPLTAPLSDSSSKSGNK